MPEMKIVADYEPGDGTRYCIGFTDLPKDQMRKLGYSQTDRIILFLFGPASIPYTGFLCINPGAFLGVNQVSRAMGLNVDTDSYIACMALYTLECMFGVNGRGEAYERFLEARAPKLTLGHFNQLVPLLDQGHPSAATSAENLGSIIDTRA